MLAGVSPPLGPARRGGGGSADHRVRCSCLSVLSSLAALKHNVGAALTQQLQSEEGKCPNAQRIGIWGQLKARSN